MLNCKNHLLWLNREIGYVAHVHMGLIPSKAAAHFETTIWNNIHQWDDQLKNDRKKSLCVL